MIILAIGDVVGSRSIDYLREKLPDFKKRHKIDFVTANGENASEIHGISEKNANDLFAAGVDLITLGNHAFGRRDIYTMLSDARGIIRPANYPPLAPGGGYDIIKICGYKVLCINILGTALMEPLACPFATVDRILEREQGNFEFSMMDIHAEATSEKQALALYFDGRINIMYGTHTHVQTADERILPGGSAYITDIGMTGPTDGVIGCGAREVIEKFRTKMPARFVVAEGNIAACAVIFSIDCDAKKVTDVRRIVF